MRTDEVLAEVDVIWGADVEDGALYQVRGEMLTMMIIMITLMMMMMMIIM